MSTLLVQVLGAGLLCRRVPRRTSRSLLSCFSFLSRHSLPSIRSASVSSFPCPSRMCVPCSIPHHPHQIQIASIDAVLTTSARPDSLAERPPRRAVALAPFSGEHPAPFAGAPALVSDGAPLAACPPHPGRALPFWQRVCRGTPGGTTGGGVPVAGSRPQRPLHPLLPLFLFSPVALAVQASWLGRTWCPGLERVWAATGGGGGGGCAPRVGLAPF